MSTNNILTYLLFCNIITTYKKENPYERVKIKIKRGKRFIRLFQPSFKRNEIHKYNNFHIFLTPNSNELFLFCGLLYTSYYKILQIIYKKKITKTTNLIKQTALINLQNNNKKKSYSKETTQIKAESKYKYYFKENSPAIKEISINKPKKLTKKR